MRVECPSCRFSAETDSSRIPPGGTKARCPRCGAVFLLSPENATLLLSGGTCPQCGFARDGGEFCPRCGLIFSRCAATEE